MVFFLKFAETCFLATFLADISLAMILLSNAYFFVLQAVSTKIKTNKYFKYRILIN